MAAEVESKGGFTAFKTPDQCINVFGPHKGAVTCAAFNSKLSVVCCPPAWLGTCSFTAAEGRYALTGGADGHIRLWNAYRRHLDGSAFLVSDFHLETLRTVNSVHVQSGNSAFASGGSDRAVTVWDVATGAATRQFKEHNSFVTCVRWAHTGQMLWSGSQDKQLRAWDTRAQRGWKPIMQMDFRDSVTCVHISADGSQVLAGSADETVRLYDVRGGCVKEVAVGDPVVDVCLGAGGHTMAVFTMGHAAAKRRPPAWQGGGEPKDPSTQPVTAPHKGTVRYLDLDGDCQLGAYTGHTCLSYPVKGALVAGEAGIISGDEGGALCMWDVEQGASTGECHRLEVGGVRKDGGGEVVGAAVPLPRYASHGDRVGVLMPSHAGVALFLGDAAEADRVQMEEQA